jgi:release factor glutamine methyltransferase
MIKLKEIVNYFSSNLDGLYDDKESRSLAFWTIEYYFNLSRSNYLLSNDRQLSEKEEIFFLSVLKRLKNNEPIQYILGEVNFQGLVFKVSKDCLIPRPETEELVNWILEYNFNSVLDVGTGSGCIAISIAKKTDANVKAIDICRKAIDIANNNAKINNISSINFEQMDVFSPNMIEKVDLLVSNPPYVLNSEKPLIHLNVLNYEPHKALFVDDENPLIFYEQIIRLSKQILNKNGLLFFEINEQMNKRLIDLLKEYNFINIEARKDLQNKPRMIKAVLA